MKIKVNGTVYNVEIEANTNIGDDTWWKARVIELDGCIMHWPNYSEMMQDLPSTIDAYLRAKGL